MNKSMSSYHQGVIEESKLNILFNHPTNYNVIHFILSVTSLQETLTNASRISVTLGSGRSNQKGILKIGVIIKNY